MVQIKTLQTVHLLRYRQVKETVPFHLEHKLELIAPKKAKNIKIFFRYARVRKLFQDVIAKTLIRYDIIKSANEISDISLRGGGIDRQKLRSLINIKPQMPEKANQYQR